MAFFILHICLSTVCKRRVYRKKYLMDKLLKSKKNIEMRTLELMETVGLAERYINLYPHELDRGRRQRVGICSGHIHSGTAS